MIKPVGYCVVFERIISFSEKISDVWIGQICVEAPEIEVIETEFCNVQLFQPYGNTTGLYQVSS